MSDDHLQQVHAALVSVPGFETLDAGGYAVTRLGGLTNLVFRIGVDHGAYVLRLPGKGTEEYIDREVELHNAIVAADAGVSAELIFARAETGLMLTRCIEFSMIDEYLAILKAKNSELPPGYVDVVAAAQPARQALAAHPARLAPCHCDPLCENFLDDGQRMWIVDWEYSGMNDPLWDLGDLSVEAGLTPAQDMEMMRAYFGGEPTEAQMGRMTVYKAMCDLLWTLWGLIQHAESNPAEDFWTYAIGRFERCKALMDAPGFEDHVAAVARG
jgi:thiamine kinase-like enzyme